MKAACLAMLLVLPLSGVRGAAATDADHATAGGDRLFAQSTGAMLDREFASDAVSYMLLDTANGDVLAERWQNAAGAIPVGSLVKPFLAKAYAEQHGGSFPVTTCHGAADRCWRPSGHGPMHLETALAGSCNAYFLALARELNQDEIAGLASAFDLPLPPPGATAETLIGLNDTWRIPPLVLARAYVRLVRNAEDTAARRILAGMALSARSGTAQQVDNFVREGALAKTGTAGCVHRPRGQGDGFTVVAYPASSPRLLLLVRVHGTTGANAAAVAGRMMRLIAGRERP